MGLDFLKARTIATGEDRDAISAVAAARALPWEVNWLRGLSHTSARPKHTTASWFLAS